MTAENYKPVKPLFITIRGSSGIPVGKGDIPANPCGDTYASGIQKDYEAMQEENARLRNERGASRRSAIMWQADIERLIAVRDRLIAERDSLAADRDCALAIVVKAEAERDEARATVAAMTERSCAGCKWWTVFNYPNAEIGKCDRINFLVYADFYCNKWEGKG